MMCDGDAGVLLYSSECRDWALASGVLHMRYVCVSLAHVCVMAAAVSTVWKCLYEGELSC
jgi:hypothetical protein